MNDKNKHDDMDGDEIPIVDRSVGDHENIEFLNREDGADDEGPDTLGAFPMDDDIDDMDQDDDPVEDPGFPGAFDPPEPEFDDDLDDDTSSDMATPIGGKASGGLGSGMSRIMIGAGVVIILIAAWVFWPRGGDPDEMLGDSTVLTLDPAGPGIVQEDPPRSSDVDLGEEVPEMVPEQSNTTAKTVTALKQQTPTRTVSETVTESLAKPATKTPIVEETSLPAIAGDPGEMGKWAVQLGAFGSEKNAQTLGDTYRGKGFRVEVPAMRTTGGGLSYKVWIGFFDTRAAADAWAVKHKSALGDYYITHR